MTKKIWPAAQRNADVVLEVLRKVLIRPGSVLEIASGTGQHAVHACSALPDLQWFPSDPDPEALASIEAWREESGLDNFNRPVLLDVTSSSWPVENIDSVYCANMIHIAPWQACLDLFKGAGQCLKAGSPLVLYGPFIQEGVETAPSNLSFDASLKSRNAAWGIRHLSTVSEVAKSNGFVREETISMPANNLSLIFRRL